MRCKKAADSRLAWQKQKGQIAIMLEGTPLAFPGLIPLTTEGSDPVRGRSPTMGMSSKAEAPISPGKASAISFRGSYWPTRVTTGP